MNTHVITILHNKLPSIIDWCHQKTLHINNYGKRAGLGDLTLIEPIAAVWFRYATHCYKSKVPTHYPLMGMDSMETTPNSQTDHAGATSFLIQISHQVDRRHTQFTIDIDCPCIPQCVFGTLYTVTDDDV